MNNTQTILTHGKGVYLFDANGKEYIDPCSGAISCNIGYGVQEIALAAEKQIKKLPFLHHSSKFTSTSLIKLKKFLLSITSESNEVFFVNSGSEGVESAIRYVIQYWRYKKKPSKVEIISRKLSYHGTTMGALSVTGHHKRREPFNHILEESKQIESPYCYRCQYNLTPNTCKFECALSLEKKILKIGKGNVAAFIAEPIIGAAGGALVPPIGYWKKIRQICDKYNVILIADEVLTGLGRTGKWLAMEHFGILADITIVGKGMGAGYTPIAATLITKKFLNHKVQIFGHTYGGNPLSCNIALAVLNYIRKNKLMSDVLRRSAEIRDRLLSCKRRFHFIGDIRGTGYLWGIEFVKDKSTKEYFAQNLSFTSQVISVAYQFGLILYPCSGFRQGDAVILAPPFTITESEMDDLFIRLDMAFLKIKEIF